MIGRSELCIGLVLRTLIGARGIGTLKERRQSNSEIIFDVLQLSRNIEIITKYGNWKKLEKIEKIRHFGNVAEYENCQRKNNFDI